MEEDQEEERDDSDQDEPITRESKAMDEDEAESDAKMFAAIFGKDRRPEGVKFQHAAKVTMSAEHLPKSMKLHVSQSNRAKPVVYRPSQVDPSVYYQAFSSAVTPDLYDSTVVSIVAGIGLCVALRVRCVSLCMCYCAFARRRARVFVCVCV